MQALWLFLALLLFLGGPFLVFVLLAVVANKLFAPWRHRMLARRLDEMARELNEAQKHRRVWLDDPTP